MEEKIPVHHVLTHHALKFAIASLLIALTSPLNAGTIVMDQNAVPIPVEDGGGLVGAGGPSYGTGAAQSFTVGVAANLDHITTMMGLRGRGRASGWPLIVELFPFPWPPTEPLARRTWDAANMKEVAGLFQKDFLVPSIPVEVGDQFVTVAFAGDPVLNNGKVSWLGQSEISNGAATNFYEAGRSFEVGNGGLASAGLASAGLDTFDFAFTTFVEVPEPSTLLLGFWEWLA